MFVRYAAGPEGPGRNAAPVDASVWTVIALPMPRRCVHGLTFSCVQAGCGAAAGRGSHVGLPLPGFGAVGRGSEAGRGRADTQVCPYRIDACGWAAEQPKRRAR